MKHRSSVLTQALTEQPRKTDFAAQKLPFKHLQSEEWGRRALKDTEEKK
ncbi:MAG: hypothetical protein PUP91_01465 [Rhizonema sp. PD37]|nr:hypothetical protein [Rhizonema sp. PD37]